MDTPQQLVLAADQQLVLAPYQRRALEHVLQHRYCALFLDMGLGKTAVVLSALRHLLTETPRYRRALIVGPKRVVEDTWPKEVGKWEQFRHFRYVQLPRHSPLWQDTAYHLYLCSRDNIAHLVNDIHDTRQRWPFDIVVLDELSSFKHRDSKRYQALKTVRPYMGRVIGMTGTPAANGYEDLWAQIGMLDMGERLGKGLTGYRRRWFYDANMGSAREYNDYQLREGAKEEIDEAIEDICISMVTEDYVQLPPIIYQEVALTMPAPLRRSYTQFKRDSVLTLEHDPTTTTIAAFTAGALANKLLQFCGGSVYDAKGTHHEVSRLKLDALADLVEECNGHALLVYYTYKFELATIQSRFPHAVDIRRVGAIDRWNEGSIPMLLAHPASAGHGLNLQAGGHTAVWYNLTYDLELYLQANKRLHRLGQGHPVSVYHLTFDRCIDSHILRHVLTAKKTLQDSLMEAVKAKEEW